ncbi:hypothetical protein FNV43_RR01283 [Rhamnella rubrinervis]|uniref:EF-hand domain-containing protein n=1 Tax=Rhamnella rubrinervis TaxID=2594499 RepID=A0A8K0HSA1_9ROSA|nr:hypothetical protein FNV43_RR01283 [Rhamnella rubrinervis]
MNEIREAAMAYYRNMPEDLRQAARSLFQSIDEDGNGKITRDEFLVACKQMDFSVEELDHKLFEELDENGDGTVDYDEFVSFFYIFMSGRLLYCDGCQHFLKGLYFTCLTCFNQGHTIVSYCTACYRDRRHLQHRHRRKNVVFVDNYALLLSKSGSTQREKLWLLSSFSWLFNLDAGFQAAIVEVSGGHRHGSNADRLQSNLKLPNRAAGFVWTEGAAGLGIVFCLAVHRRQRVRVLSCFGFERGHACIRFVWSRSPRVYRHGFVVSRSASKPSCCCSRGCVSSVEVLDVCAAAISGWVLGFQGDHAAEVNFAQICAHGKALPKQGIVTVPMRGTTNKQVLIQGIKHPSQVENSGGHKNLIGNSGSLIHIEIEETKTNSMLGENNWKNGVVTSKHVNQNGLKQPSFASVVRILTDLTKGIGIPLKIDNITLSSNFGHYARVLVDIDLLSVGNPVARYKSVIGKAPPKVGTHGKEKETKASSLTQMYKPKQVPPLHVQSTTSFVHTSNVFEVLNIDVTPTHIEDMAHPQDADPPTMAAPDISVAASMTDFNTKVVKSVRSTSESEDTFGDSDDGFDDHEDDRVEDEWPPLKDEGSSKPSKAIDGFPNTNQHSNVMVMVPISLNSSDNFGEDERPSLQGKSFSKLSNEFNDILYRGQQSNTMTMVPFESSGTLTAVQKLGRPKKVRLQTGVQINTMNFPSASETTYQNLWNTVKRKPGRPRKLQISTEGLEGINLIGMSPIGATLGISLDASGSVVSIFEKAMEASLSTQVFNLWTTAIVNALSAIWSLGVAGASSRAPKIISVVWSPPPMGWLKINTDDAADGYPSPDRYHLWLECDSTCVVNLLIHREDVVPWAYKARWVNCLHYVSSINFQVSHIFTEGNIVADALSKIAISSPGAQWW